MVPLPEPVLSVAIDTASAFSNIASGPGGMVPGPDSVLSVSTAETVWVSVRSTSVNDSVPEVGTFAFRSPPGTLVPPENSMVAGTVTMTGASLLPRVIVMVKDWVPASSLGVKLLSTRAI